MSYAEIRNTHCWGPLYEPGTDIYADINPDLLAGISIDTWKTNEPSEEGCVVANVLLTTTGSIVVDFHDNAARLSPQVLESIREAKNILADAWKEKDRTEADTPLVKTKYTIVDTPARTVLLDPDDWEDNDDNCSDASAFAEQVMAEKK